MNTNQIKTDEEKIDVKLMDKDVLQEKFENAIEFKNYIDEYLRVPLMIIHKLLQCADDDNFWNKLMDDLYYPFHVKCITNEPNVSVEEKGTTDNVSYWLSGDVIAISPDNNLFDNRDRMTKRLRIDYDMFNCNDITCTIIYLVVEAFSIIQKALVDYKKSTEEYLEKYKGNLSPEEEKFWTDIVANIEIIFEHRLISPRMIKSVETKKEEK